MRKPHHLAVILCTLAVNVFASGNLLAEQTHNNESIQTSLGWTESMDRDGFTWHVPSVDTQQLAETITRLHTDLVQEQRQLAGKVEDTRLGASDAVITAIMPGGLLYAGYRKREHGRAKNALASVNAAVDALANDLLATRSLANTVAQRD